MTGDIPQWALLMARRLRDEESGINPSMCPMDWAFARYIAAHEEPPVDPLLIEARDIVAKWWEAGKDIPGRGQSYRDGRFDHDAEVQQALTALKRGMELASKP